MKRKINKKIVAGLVISLFSTQMMQALAQGVATQSSGNGSSLTTSSPTIGSLPNLTTNNINGAPANCNKEIMQNLNSQYLQTRGDARSQQYNNEMNGLVLTTPKANQMDCFQQAMQNIKNLMTAINSIIAMFSGQIDMDAIMQQMVNMVLKAACQEINQVTGSISNSLGTYTNTINGTVGAINNTPIGAGGVSTSVGGIIAAGNGSNNTGATDIIGGSATSLSNTLGSIGTTTSAAGSTGSALVNKIQSVSPFSASN